MNATESKMVQTIVGLHAAASRWLTDEPSFSTQYQRAAYADRYMQTDAMLRMLQCSSRRSAERAYIMRDMRTFIASLPTQVF